jgi:hypothetical protein
MLFGREGHRLKDLYPFNIYFGALSLPLIPYTLLASVRHKFVNALQGITKFKTSPLLGRILSSNIVASESLNS